MNYFSKYQKYKTKYLKLKQIAGTAGKCVSGRSKPNEKIVYDFLNKYSITEDDFKNGILRKKGIEDIPECLPLDNMELKNLDLSINKIVDVSKLTLPQELQTLNLYWNQIKDVSMLTLPQGLKELNLSFNRIVDVSNLTLPPTLKKLSLAGNDINLSTLILPNRLEELDLGNNKSQLIYRRTIPELYDSPTGVLRSKI